MRIKVFCLTKGRNKAQINFYITFAKRFFLCFGLFVAKMSFFLKENFKIICTIDASIFKTEKKKKFRPAKKTLTSDFGWRI